MNNQAAASAKEGDERLRRRERDIGEYIREEPLTSLAMAGGVGFILGGGANSRIGLALLTIVGRLALRGAAANFIVDLVTRNRGNQRQDRAKPGGERHRNGSHDNSRTDFRDSD